MSRYSAIPPKDRLPEWLRRPLGDASAIEQVQGLVKRNGLHTICEEGRCPNRGECYAAGTATFCWEERSAPAAARFVRWTRARLQSPSTHWSPNAWLMPSPL